MSDCPKCNAKLPAWMDDLPEWDRAHNHAQDDCVYVCCDDPKCHARKNPRTIEEYEDALEHWRDHSYLMGCSHAR